MELIYKEVRFDIYCPKCKHKETNEEDDPCNGCLDECVNENSHKPVNFEEE